ncbi:hypothetical protein M422DRAFT_241361 [Sphaerobolus stellatus SS14]|nr:hypothetical protein M422DRAFT_241361 [Sphaerobolus stellatus SS14]
MRERGGRDDGEDGDVFPEPKEYRMGYYGSEEYLEKKMPAALLKNESGEKLKLLLLPKVLVLTSERDPQNFLDCADEFKKALLDNAGIQTISWSLKGRNHVSTITALYAGEGKEWAEKVIRLIKD